MLATSRNKEKQVLNKQHEQQSKPQAPEETTAEKSAAEKEKTPKIALLHSEEVRKMNNGGEMV